MYLVKDDFRFSASFFQAPSFGPWPPPHQAVTRLQTLTHAPHGGSRPPKGVVTQRVDTESGGSRASGDVRAAMATHTAESNNNSAVVEMVVQHPKQPQLKPAGASSFTNGDIVRAVGVLVGLFSNVVSGGIYMPPQVRGQPLTQPSSESTHLTRTRTSSRRGFSRTSDARRRTLRFSAT